MEEGWKRGIRTFWHLMGPLLLYALVNDLTVSCWVVVERLSIPYLSYIPRYVASAMFGAFALWLWHRKDGSASLRRGRGRSKWIMLVPAAAASCFFLNHLLVLLGIPSEGYDNVKHLVFHRPLIWQVAGSGFFVPLAEELVFRDLGYGRLRREMDVFPAAVATAALFGLYHGNLIQGIYAFLMGLLLALVWEVCGGLAASWLFHGAANLTAILLTGTPAAAWLEGHRPILFGLMAFAGTVLLGFVLKLREDID